MKINKYMKSAILSFILTMGVMIIGFTIEQPLRYFEYMFIDIISYFGFRILHELKEND